MLHDGQGHHSRNYKVKADKMYFIHVPKSGGTTVRKILADNFPQYISHKWYHRPINPKYPPNTENRYITSIRNPVDRVWSYYQVVKNNTQSPWYKFAIKGLESLLHNSWECQNMYCKYLTGHNNSFSDSAILNLQNFLYVFDFDDLHNSIEGFFELMGEQYNNHNLHLMKTKGKQPINNEQARLISDYNKQDIEIWEFFKKNI